MATYFKFLFIFIIYLVFTYLKGVKDVKQFKREVGAFIAISIILLVIAMSNRQRSKGLHVIRIFSKYSLTLENWNGILSEH